MSAPAVDASPALSPLDCDPAPAQLAPVPAAERIALLDVLRGVALYGVLLANTVWFSGRAFFTKEELLAHSGRFDEPAALVIRLFVDGKAMSLFSFLFGLGFAVQLDRAAARGRDGLPVYLRRLGVLLLLGLAHVVLLWWGDILTNYALTGLVLVLFRKRSNRALLAWALFLAFVPEIVGAVPAVAAFFERTLPGPGDHDAFNARMLDALRGHDRPHLTWMHLRKALYHPMGMPLSFLTWTLSRFLVGYAVGRSRVLQRIESRRPLFRKLLGVGLLVAAVCAAAFFVRRGFVRGGGTLAPWTRIVLQIPDEIGVLATDTFYVAGLALLMLRPTGQRVLMVLAPVGQMALTNYLSQSLICTFLFYGWGLGLLGHVGTALCIPITLGIFLAQVLWSRAWLRRFRFGPVEWLWRSLAYGARQPMRRAEPL